MKCLIFNILKGKQRTFAFLLIFLAAFFIAAQAEGGEESGRQYTKGQTCEEVRRGIKLHLKYDKSSSAFLGILKNISKRTIANVRLVVHLSNLVELGPPKLLNLAPGKSVNVNLSAKGQAFTWWSAHAESGNSEHGHGEQGEHGHIEKAEHKHGEQGEHAHGEESGKRYAKNQICEEVRKGIKLYLKYDKLSSTFIGTVKNISKRTASKVRLEVHLSNKVELGPTKPLNLAPGKLVKVKLTAKGQAFTWWSAHAESGSSEHGHEEKGEHDHERKSTGQKE